MTINSAAFKEILSREGDNAALNYLITAEKLSQADAQALIDFTNKTSPTASYYCERDNNLFVGQSSVCPICHGDVMKDECSLDYDQIPRSIDNIDEVAIGMEPQARQSFWQSFKSLFI